MLNRFEERTIESSDGTADKQMSERSGDHSKLPDGKNNNNGVGVRSKCSKLHVILDIVHVSCLDSSPLRRGGLGGDAP